MGFGAVLLFAAIIILALGIKGMYQHLPLWKNSTEDPGANRNGNNEDPGAHRILSSSDSQIQNAIDLIKRLQKF